MITMTIDQQNLVQSLSNEFANFGLRLEITETPYISGCVFKPTPKAKFKKEKMVYGYKFRSIDSMLLNLTTYLNNYKSNKEYDERMKAERKAKDEELANSVQIGDVFHSSWGHEQTNCDFYQVVAKPSAKTVVIRQISRETVEECGWASEYCRPVKDAFIGGEETKRLSGEWIKFSSYRSASKITKDLNTAKFYRSWYA